jgi:ABC-type uncharacterized transport system ATPase subunit
MVSGTLEELKSRSEHLHLEVTVDGHEWKPEIAGGEFIGNAWGNNRYLIDRDSDLQQLLERARAEGTITKFSVEPPRLSDIFREAVQR